MIELFNARLGMSSSEVRALAPTGPGGQACIPEGDARLFLLECGRYRMTALFTDAGRAWRLRASVDLTGSPEPPEILRSMLQRRFGPAVVLDTGPSPILVWLPRRGTARMALRCFNESGLLGALL